MPAGSSFLQRARAAVTHRLIVQTPRVYPSAPTVRLVVQSYDAFGNAAVATPSLAASLTMGTLVLSSFSVSTSGNTRFYTATLQPDWFTAANAAGETVAVATTLNGQHTQSSSLQVCRHPLVKSPHVQR